ncbi:MAG: NAD(P)-dependent oxidoreductase [Nitrososphaeria archaeon]|jgi:3-hydroxyisobutyrate dehydrogenase
METKIGFIGLGLMGKPMATNLIKAGYSLTVWNRTSSKMDEILALNAKGAGSPKEVAEKTDVVITMLTDSPDVEEVILGPSGVIRGVRKGVIVIDMSTISPKVTKKVAERLLEKDVEMLDAPVTGGQIGAINATLSIMVGGNEKVFEKCLPIFQALGKRVTYMGAHGNGQIAKLCNQIMCVLNIQGVCEGLMLGAKAGIDLNKLIEVLTGGAANSWQLANQGPKIVKGDLEPGFKMKTQQKDLRLVLETASELDLPLPGTALVNQIFRIAEAEGLGEKGTQAAIKSMEKISGYRITPS